MERPTLGDIVRNKRLELGLTQLELAERLDMSQRWVSSLELGNVGQSRIKTLQALASVLDLEIEELIIVTGQATTRAGAKEVADSVPREESPAYQRASYSHLPDLTEENHDLVADFIEMLWAKQEKEYQNTKNQSRRKKT